MYSAGQQTTSPTSGVRPPVVENVLVPLVCSNSGDENCAPTLTRYYVDNFVGVNSFYKPYFDAIVIVATMWLRSICSIHATNNDPEQYANDLSVCMRAALDNRFPYFSEFKVPALGELSTYESVFVKAGLFLRGLAAPTVVPQGPTPSPEGSSSSYPLGDPAGGI